MNHTETTLNSIVVFALKRMQWAAALLTFAAATLTLSSAASALTTTAGYNNVGDCTFGCSRSLQQLYHGITTQFDYSAVSAVPLPAALPLFGTGIAILGFMGWRRKHNAPS